MPEPSAFFDLAETVLDCICSTMETLHADDPTYPGCPCYAFVSVGAPALDSCCGNCSEGDSHGLLAVTLNNVLESNSFPNSDPATHPCAAQLLVAEIGVTVARCVPTIEETGRQPTAALIEASSLVLYTDLWATLIALTCCVTASPSPGRRKRRVAVTQAGPQDADGGCGSITVTALVEAGVLCPCPAEGS